MDFPKLSGQRRAFLAEATGRYSAAFEGSLAAEYLLGRGISLEVAQSFQLGYVHQPAEGHDLFRGRVAIPYLTPTGVSCIRFRDLDPETTRKYDQEAGARTPLFNVRDLHRSEPWIAVCEGELDTVVMSGVLGVPAVGVPGVEHWDKNGEVWSRLLQDYDSVFIVLDPDKAGKKFIPRIASMVQNPVVVNLPADVNDTAQEHGPEWVLEKMGLD